MNKCKPDLIRFCSKHFMSLLRTFLENDMMTVMGWQDTNFFIITDYLLIVVG